MNRISKSFLGAFWSISILLGILISFSSSAAICDDSSVKIGVVYGFTGAAQAWSEFGRQGLELAKEEINAAGGVHGKKLELIYEDSKTNPTQAVSAYRNLVGIHKVKIVLGNVWDFITAPLIPLAAQDHVLLLSPTVMPENISSTNANFFSMGEHTPSIEAPVELFFERHPEIKKVGIFCWDDPWGQSYLKVWREVAAKKSIEISQALCTIDFASDFRTDVAKMKSAKVDALIISHLSGTILQRLREQGIKVPVLATSNILEDMELSHLPKDLFEGTYVTEWQPSAEFREKFVKRFGTEPLVEAHNSYEALRSVARALAFGEPDLLSARHKVHYEGVAGEINFTDSNFGNLSIAKLYQVHNGKLVLVE